MSYSITTRIGIDAGHRLLKHEGKCKHPHGHRYEFLITCGSVGLDAVGRVVDFSVVKEDVGGWLLDKWDHGFIYEQGDPIGPMLAQLGAKSFAVTHPPTAEYLAKFLYEIAKQEFEPTQRWRGVEILRVRLYETPNNYADYPGNIQIHEAC